MTGRSLLLVDDDEASTQILGIILGDEGYEIDSAASGAEAEEKASRRKYDLVLLDYVLPDAKGHELAAKFLRRDPALKIILLTGYSQMTDDMSDYDVSYAKVFLKPVSPDEIVGSVREALGRGP